MSLALPLCPETVVEFVRRRGAQGSQQVNHSRGRQINERGLRTWRLSWSSYRADVQLRALWSATKGPALPFEFTPPGAAMPVSVRFAGPVLTTSHEGAVTTTAEIEVEEVR